MKSGHNKAFPLKKRFEQHLIIVNKLGIISFLNELLELSNSVPETFECKQFNFFFLFGLIVGIWIGVSQDSFFTTILIVFICSFLGIMIDLIWQLWNRWK